MRSMSRNGRDRSRSPNGRDRSRSERGRTNEKRSGSKENKKEYRNCIGCKCVDCEKMRKNAKELSVNWCEEYKLSAFVPNEEILVNYTEKGKQVMILDLGAPVSLAGNEWMNQYLKDHGLELKDLKSSKCYQKFRFGPSKQYISRLMVELPVIVRRLDGKEDVLQVFTYLVDADVPFLCGKREMVD